MNDDRRYTPPNFVPEEEPPLPDDMEFLGARDRKRFGPSTQTKFKVAVERFIRNRANGMSEKEAFERSGLPQREGILRMLRKRRDVDKRVAKAAVRRVNIVSGTEDALRTLHRFASEEEIPARCTDCGKSLVIKVSPDTQIRAAAEFLKVVARTDILTIRERAEMEQNPETRVQLAERVLGELSTARPALVPLAPALETSLVTKEPANGPPERQEPPTD